MIVKLLTEHHLEVLSLKGGCTGSSESIHVKMPHCWKSHAMAHLILRVYVYDINTMIMKNAFNLTKATYTFKTSFSLRFLKFVFQRCCHICTLVNVNVDLEYRSE